MSVNTLFILQMKLQWLPIICLFESVQATHGLQNSHRCGPLAWSVRPILLSYSALPSSCPLLLLLVSVSGCPRTPHNSMQLQNIGYPLIYSLFLEANAFFRWSISLLRPSTQERLHKSGVSTYYPPQAEHVAEAEQMIVDWQKRSGQQTFDMNGDFPKGKCNRLVVWK